VSRRRVQLVADYGPDDLAFAETAQALELAVAGADVRLTQVPASDSLAAGWCAANLALCPGPPGQLVVIDIAAPEGDHYCVGRTADGVEVVSANSGWAWSFLAGEVSGPYCMEVPAGERAAQLLAEAVVRIAKRQPHALLEPLLREKIPAVPESVVAFVQCDGSLETTIPYTPGVVGERVRVRIGDAAATALITEGRASVEDGALALRPGPRSNSALTVRGGSAAELFCSPSSGAPVALDRP
jgi:hypothetical protein